MVEPPFGPEETFEDNAEPCQKSVDRTQILSDDEDGEEDDKEKASKKASIIFNVAASEEDEEG